MCVKKKGAVVGQLSSLETALNIHETRFIPKTVRNCRKRTIANILSLQAFNLTPIMGRTCSSSIAR